MFPLCDLPVVKLAEFVKMGKLERLYAGPGPNYFAYKEENSIYKNTYCFYCLEESKQEMPVGSWIIKLKIKKSEVSKS